MSRESPEQKAARYLAEGRVVISTAGPGYVDATVRGDGEVYKVGYRRGSWFCSCPARGRCAHLLAVGLVTAPSSGGAQ
jgi:uncharacterized Zn finger protein